MTPDANVADPCPVCGALVLTEPVWWTLHRQTHKQRRRPKPAEENT